MKRILFITAILAIAGGKSYSETHTARLENSIITDTNFETTVIDTPKNVTIITKEDIAERGAQTVAEALKSVPNLYIKNMTGKDSTFDLRGQGATALSNIVVLKNGTPLNSINMSGYRTSSIDISTVERIEVIPSGGSVLYGDGAIGGVINIITKSPEDRENYGVIGVEGGSFDYTKLYGSYGTKIGDKLLLDGNYSTRNKKGYRNNSKDNLDSLDLKGKYLLEGGDITFGYSHTKDSYRGTGYLTKDQVEENDKQEGGWISTGDTNEDRYTLDFRKKVSEKVEIALYGSYSHKDYDFGWDKGTTETGYLKPQLKIAYGGENDIILGGDLYKGESESKTKTSIKKDSEGVFALNTFRQGGLELTQGYRRQHIKYGGNKLKEQRTFNEDAVNLAANYLLNPESSIYMSYVTAFRTPNTDELNLWTGDYEPQRSHTYEIGGKTFLGNSFISIALFYIETENEIIYDGINKNHNMVGKNERVGGEISLEHYFEKLTLRENFSVIKSKMKEEPYRGKEIPEVPRYMANIGATYRVTENFRTNLDIYYRGNSYYGSDFQNSFSRVSGYTTADLNIDYDFDFGLTLYGGVKNLFDKKYYDLALVSSGKKYYYPAEGRSFYVGAKYRF